MSLIHPYFTVGGPDVSHWQGPIDWALLGIRANFAIIRAGDGISGGKLDSKWQANWEGARGKLARGAYWFYRSTVDPVQQVDWLEAAYAHVGDDYGEMGFFIDLEKDGGRMGISSYTAGLVKFLYHMDGLLASRNPKNPLTGIYTSYGWWDVKVNPSLIPDLDRRAKWTAQWFYNTTPGPRRLPFGWEAWDIWQFTAQGDARAFIGNAPGASKSLDLNVFHGDAAEFARRFNLGALPPPPVDDRIVVGFRPVRAGMNVRNLPTEVASTVLLKTTAEVLPVLDLATDERGRIWYRIGGRDDSQLWICSTTGEPVFA